MSPNYGVWLSLVERYVRDVEVAGSNPVTSTRLSLDAIRVPGSAISFALPLALVAGRDLVTSTSGKLPLPSRDHRFCGGRDFCCPRFYPAAVLFSRPVRLWPDFQPEDFLQALEWYQKQDVTLGG